MDEEGKKVRRGEAKKGKGEKETSLGAEHSTHSTITAVLSRPECSGNRFYQFTQG